MSTNEARTAGSAAYRAGAPRIAPLADFTPAGTLDTEVGSIDKAAARAWYAGWDAANLADA